MEKICIKNTGITVLKKNETTTGSEYTKGGQNSSQTSHFQVYHFRHSVQYSHLILTSFLLWIHKV